MTLNKIKKGLLWQARCHVQWKVANNLEHGEILDSSGVCYVPNLSSLWKTIFMFQQLKMSHTKQC